VLRVPGSPVPPLWEKLLRGLAQPLAPSLCVACSAHAGAAEPLCRSCRGELRWLGPDLASACGVEVWAPLAYDGPARAIVKALKFGRLPRLAETMAAQIAANAPPRALAAGALVPVPLHPSRLRRRGYNQAERLAVALAARTGAPLADCLERFGDRRTQVGRDRRARLRGISGSVRLRGGEAAPAAATLVDDVATTGATLAACAEALRAAGARRVTAITYARTLGR
jgi:ComF family protein